MNRFDDFVIVAAAIASFVESNNGVSIEEIHKHLGGDGAPTSKERLIIVSVLTGIEAQRIDGRWRVARSS